MNLTDPQFTGSYHGRRKHASDLDAVVHRAHEKGVEKLLITGTSLKESREALDMAKKYSACFFGSVDLLRANDQVCTVLLDVTQPPRARSRNIRADWMGTWKSSRR